MSAARHPYRSIARRDHTIGASVTVMEAHRIAHVLRDVLHYRTVSEGVRDLLLIDAASIERRLHDGTTDLKANQAR